MIGTTLSHFRVTAKLGEGGMGEVYRATDTKLGREVAIKVLPEAVANDPERLARFEREAKVLASLNHPHIAAIYSIEAATPAGRPEARLTSLEYGDATFDEPPAGAVGTAPQASHPRDDEARDERESSRAQPQHTLAERGDSPPRPLHFLVMELAEGEDLADRVARGPVPIDEALPIALQMAEALEAAHERGIIHRDLKPANVKVDNEGNVKVLDFGLAKALDPTTSWEGASPSPTALSLSPTLTAQMTEAGVILGTAAYMSPEQARGKPVDARADLWAFGALLYEMLTGIRLFAGDTVTDVLASVVKTEPDWDSLPPDTPTPIRRLLERCLVKDRDLRLHHAGDARLEILVARQEEPAPPEETRPISRASWIPWLVAGAASLVALLALVGGSQKPTAYDPLIRFQVELPAGANPLEPWIGPAVALSPSGDELVLSVVGAENTPLYRRTLDETTPQPIAGTEGGALPFFSPDGSSLGFFRNGEIVVMLLPGGVPTRVVGLHEMVPARTLGDRGACWTEDGTIVFAASQESALYRVSAAGGEPEALTQLEGTERSHRWPALLPGRNAVLFTVEDADDLSFDEAHIEAVDLATGDRKMIAEGASMPHYSPSGHLLYIRGGDLYAARFDLESLATTGAPVAVYSGVLHHAPSGSAAYHVSRSGSLVVVPEFRQVELDLVLRNPDGSVRLLWAPEQSIDSLRASPDGRLVALLLDREVWLYDLERGIPTRLTSDTNAWGGLTWSPDGERIVFSAQPRGLSLSDMYWISTLADEPATPVFDDDQSREPGSWTADGFVVFEHLGDIYRVDPSSPDSVEQLTDTPSAELAATASPDGRWVAYTSAESGSPEVYIRRIESGARRHRISTDGGARPTWSPDGRTIYYQSRGAILAVEVELGATVELGSPTVIVPGTTPDFGQLQQFRSFDVLPTPGALVMLKPRRELPPPNPIVTLNWARELEELVP